MATGVPDTLLKFWRAEEERGSEAGDIILAINEICAAVVGSIIIARLSSHKRADDVIVAVSNEYQRYMKQLVDLARTAGKTKRNTP